MIDNSGKIMLIGGFYLLYNIEHDDPDYFCISKNKEGIIDRYKIFDYNNLGDGKIEIYIDYFPDVCKTLNKYVRNATNGLFDNEYSLFINSFRFCITKIEIIDNNTFEYGYLNKSFRYPQIDRVEYNKTDTTVFWKDGSKTSVSCYRKDKYDLEKAFAFAIAKKILLVGEDYNRNFNKVFQKYLYSSMVEKKYLMKVFQLPEHSIHLTTGDTIVMSDNTDGNEMYLCSPEDSKCQYGMIEFGLDHSYSGPIMFSSEAKILLRCKINKEHHEIVIKEVAINKYITKKELREYLKQLTSKCFKDDFILYTNMPFTKINIEEE